MMPPGCWACCLKKHLVSPRSPNLSQEFVKAMKLDKLPYSADGVKVEV